MNASMHRIGLTIAAVGLLALSGCQTTPKVAEPGEERIGQLVPFQPLAATARMQWTDGNYPNLFGPTSYALWIPPGAGEGSTAIDPAAAAMSSNFHVFQLHLESIFEDSSVAYDVVGLRNVSVYLSAPDGTRVMPAQVMIGADLMEKQHGALRHYGRTNTVVFPKNPFLTPIPASAQAAPPLRLVIEGYDTKYQCLWHSMMPEDPGKAPIRDRQSFQNFQQVHEEADRRGRAFLHNFD